MVLLIDYMMNQFKTINLFSLTKASWTDAGRVEIAPEVEDSKRQNNARINIA